MFGWDVPSRVDPLFLAMFLFYTECQQVAGMLSGCCSLCERCIVREVVSLATCPAGAALNGVCLLQLGLGELLASVNTEHGGSCVRQGQVSLRSE